MRIWTTWIVPSVSLMALVITPLSLLLSDKRMAVIGLIAFVVFLLAILLSFLLVTRQYLTRKYPQGYKTISRAHHYIAKENGVIRFKSVTVIQAKQLFLRKYSHKFKWTGSGKAKWISGKGTGDQIGKHNYSGEDHKFDTVEVKFSRPIMYNETKAIELYCTLQDPNRTSAPICGLVVEEPIEIIELNVYFEDGSTIGQVEFKKSKWEKQVTPKWEVIETIALNNNVKSINRIISSPKHDRVYILTWPQLPKVVPITK